MIPGETARRIGGAVVVAVLIAGCGGGVSGKYVGGEDSLLDSLTFKGDGRVDVTIANGLGGEGTYEVDGEVVRVTANGITHELAIGDDGCLRGALMVGTLCKGD